MTFVLGLANVISWLVAQIYNNDDHNSQSKVCHSLVQDEDEDWFATDPGLVDGDDGGDYHKQIEEGLGDELDNGDDVEARPDNMSSLCKPCIILCEVHDSIPGNWVVSDDQRRKSLKINIYKIQTHTSLGPFALEEAVN